MSDSVTPKQPRPSIYVRLMPLMYGLIGATAALLLSSLICGTPISPPADTRCKPQPAPHPNASQTRRAAVAAADPALSTAASVVVRVRDSVTATPDAARRGGPTKSAPTRSAPTRSDPAKSASTKSVPAKSAPAKSATGSLAPRTASGRVKAAIAPCVRARARARSFRVAVRLDPDSKVRRVFTAKDPGVNAAMITCIQRKLAGMPLPFNLSRPSYVEWRVRQADKELSLTLVRQLRPRRR